jgi:hypothetical protein
LDIPVCESSREKLVASVASDRSVLKLGEYSRSSVSRGIDLVIESRRVRRGDSPSFVYDTRCGLNRSSIERHELRSPNCLSDCVELSIRFPTRMISFSVSPLLPNARVCLRRTLSPRIDGGHQSATENSSVNAIRCNYADELMTCQYFHRWSSQEYLSQYLNREPSHPPTRLSLSSYFVIIAYLAPRVPCPRLIAEFDRLHGGFTRLP